MSIKNISVLTIVHNRQPALLNLIQGLEFSQLKPTELVIVYMNEPPYKLPKTSFPIIECSVGHPTHLPLAQARNKAVQVATFEHLIFLDVDCIPHPAMVQQYADAFEQTGVLWSGSVRYLRKEAVQQGNFWQHLEELSDPDPIRANTPTLPYHLFWSLNFGCDKLTFAQIGQFDENYVGYGAEDTDFAFCTRQSGTPLRWVGALAYHQYHPSYDPPINHLQAIIANATYFKKKWQVWPMEGWLTKFQQLGLIHWTADRIEFLRQPSATELAVTIKD
ncbi:MAG: glycosyltransferase [Cytophagaceae bacterium]|nr:MAG: glycosyltransferase [Cytophagaceae bacterium]